MLIGINGYIGSGKDTVGKIIQYLEYCKDYPHNSRSFENWESNVGNHSKWKIKKFAGKLKEIASLMTGIPVEKFEDQEFKKTFLGKEWNYSVALDRDTMLQEHKYWEEKQMTIREFLQRLGTEAIRDGLHTNAWVNALFADYKPIPYFKHEEDLVADVRYPNWIITDTRFPNEAQAIKDRGGIVIRVNRQKQGIQIDDLSQSLHPSETSLDDWNFDYIIENNGTIDNLTEKVSEMLTKFQIL
jgi:hypothetical protein